ncbi:hypothetical protein [Bacillus sp. JJ722]|uniref:hypothetical protein n=1 Tax=Bacillus sp. JJ722 TaxID=3122973 RepID=UPI002FFFE911
MRLSQSSNNFGGGIIVALNDTVEVISNSNEELYGVIGTVIGIEQSDMGTELRIETEDGFKTWIDIEDVELCQY